jgi:signal transduction histidine kinase
MVYLSGTDTTDLHEALEQLARRSDELERSNAELERFAGVVSHDLRSSLTAVTGFLMLLERRHGHELDDDGRVAAGLRGRGERAHALAGGGPARVRARGSTPDASRSRSTSRARPPRGATVAPARPSRRPGCRSCARCRASSSSCWRT